MRLIVPPEQEPDSTTAAKYLRSIGCEILSYSPGIFKTSCPVLVSFAEGWKLFPLIKENNDRPGWVVYSDCMHYASDDEVAWFKENLIDEFIFQTRALADKLGPEIVRRAQKSVHGRHGYRAFINPRSDFFPLRFSPKPAEDFTVMKVGRDHEEKWHPDSCRMFCGINAPANRKVRIEIAGWGPEGAKKIGDVNDPNNKWFNEITTITHSRIYDFNLLASIYNKAHILIHVCDYQWEEALGRVFLESFASGVVVIADRRGGANELIRHGQTGFLVDTPDEAAYFASHLAFNEKFRISIAAQAWAELVASGHGNIDRCFAWWEELLKKAKI